MAGEYDCLKLENQLCFPLYVCSKEIIRKYRPYLDPLGLTYTQYITMMALWEKDSISVMDLGKELHLDSGTLTPLLRKLEEKGLIKRERDPSDERSLIVTVTDEGLKLKDEAKNIPASIGSCLNISVNDAIALHDILKRLMSSFDS